MIVAQIGRLMHIPTAAAAMILFLRPNLAADQPENKPPMAVPAVYVDATAPRTDIQPGSSCT